MPMYSERAGRTLRTAAGRTAGTIRATPTASADRPMASTTHIRAMIFTSLISSDLLIEPPTIARLGGSIRKLEHPRPCGVSRDSPAAKKRQALGGINARGLTPAWGHDAGGNG